MGMSKYEAPGGGWEHKRLSAIRAPPILMNVAYGRRLAKPAAAWKIGGSARALLGGGASRIAVGTNCLSG